MDILALRSAVGAASESVLKEALVELLQAHAMPVFGAAKTVEHEIAAIRALQRLGLISSSPDEFELVFGLRVTKAKARSLIYQMALRDSANSVGSDQSLRDLISRALVAMDGDKVLIEVSQPLLMDALRQRIRALGYVSDGSYSGSIARIQIPAMAALVKGLIPEAERNEVLAQLKRQGMPGDDLQSVLTGLLRKMGMKLAGHVGDEIMGRASDYLCTLVSENSASALKKLRTIW